MKWLFGLAVIVALALTWSLWGRDWLKARNWRLTNAFFAWIEPLEIKLWKNSKTIFVARLKMLTGLLLTLGTQLGAVDITPLMPFVPDAWEPAVRVLWNLLPLVLTALGWMDEYLRKETTKPLEEIALPENKPPEVEAAVAKVAEAQAEAKVAIEVAKAEGTV